MSIKTIVNSCQILNGHAFKSSDYVDNGIRVIRIANVQKGYIEDSTPAFYPLDSKGLENYMLKEGDLLMSLTGNVGRVALLSSEMLPAALNQRVACLRLKDNSIDKKFLFHYLNSSNFENKCIQESKGVAQKNMSTEWLKRQELPNFPYAKQKEISKVLDNISSIIKAKTNQILDYDQLIKSRFVEMFDSFKKTDLSNIAEIIMGQSPDSAYYNQNGVGFPFFQGKADFGAKYTNVSYWTTKPSKTAKKGNVLMSVRAPVGPVNISSLDCCIGRGLCSINAIPNKTNNEFLYNALIAIQDQITAMGTGSTFKAINKSDVYAIQLPLAPISLQNEFANFVEQVDKLIFAVRQSLNETQQLFDSLMQEYFG
jgi:type I restriction enzyme S subunit